jgi:hypothetical protein
MNSSSPDLTNCREDLVMNSGIVRGLLLAGLCALVPASAARAAEPIRPGQFNDLQTLIRPCEGEQRWTQIPWLSSLSEARRRAAAECKPILLWEMDGHPLGCT